MKRKSFEYIIGKAKLLFFERNKGDSDFIAMSDRLRAHNFAFIQMNTADADDKGMLLMACDQCAYEREIDGKLVDGAVIGCFPDLYSALSGNMPDQVITL